MKNSDEEKRKNKRFAFANPVPTSFIIMGDFFRLPNVVDVKGEIIDVSNSGLQIRMVGEPPEKGSVIRVLVPISVVSKTQAVIPVLTQVRWVKSTSKENHSVGTKFMA